MNKNIIINHVVDFVLATPFSSLDIEAPVIGLTGAFVLENFIQLHDIIKTEGRIFYDKNITKKSATT